MCTSRDTPCYAGGYKNTSVCIVYIRCTCDVKKEVITLDRINKLQLCDTMLPITVGHRTVSGECLDKAILFGNNVQSEKKEELPSARTRGNRPLCACGTRFVSHKVAAINRFIEHYGAYLNHLIALTEDPCVKAADKQKLKGSSCCIFSLAVLSPMLIHGVNTVGIWS